LICSIIIIIKKLIFIKFATYEANFGIPIFCTLRIRFLSSERDKLGISGVKKNVGGCEKNNP
jgi:hypothetical protein